MRFEGDGGRVRAVVTADATGVETTTPADTVAVDLGLAPRDLLARMAGAVPVSVVGDAAADLPLPPPPTEGVVCGCMGTTVADLGAAWDRGFTELELLKRASQACLGPCQGGACLPQVRSWIAARTGEVPDPFTARPASRQITLAEAGADGYVDAFRRTPLHDEHLALGARMDRFGGWWRPWHYGDAVSEYWAVREGVSIGDVSTLGKLVVSGPDVVELLERHLPVQRRGHQARPVALRPAPQRARSRDGRRDDPARERDPVRAVVHVGRRGQRGDVAARLDRGLGPPRPRAGPDDVARRDQRHGAAGRGLLQRAGLADPPRFLGHVHADVAGVPCHVMRLSFTGEAAFELHHPVDRSVELWRALLDLGADLGIRPHGLQALFGLRLEKGHVIVGMDTELDTTPRRLGMDWAVRMEKPRFIGRASLERTAKLPDHRRWVGFTMPGVAPAEGAPIWSGGEVVGNVTGSWTSPLLGQALMLGWLRRTPFPDRVEIDGREAVVTSTPFYDPEGHRARA